ncbi:MAG: ribulose-phosphate 3-epimerase [Anaerolineaceae bacterium]|nr:ribulose-phosphate 3-epimerase [Anaerolineaceae bacterium]
MMKTKMLISPSILSADFRTLEDQIRACEEAGADAIHIDVMDGRFVPTITFGQLIVKTCRQITNLPLDCHLMVQEPEKQLESFAKAGADAISVHWETCPHIHRTLQSIRNMGLKAGLTFNPATPLEGLAYLTDVVDLVLIMSVNPGFGGQAFIPSSLAKIKKTAQILQAAGSSAIIQVDGGIDAHTIASVYQAGARNVVAGTAVFGHTQGIHAGMAALREGLKQ